MSRQRLFPSSLHEISSCPSDGAVVAHAVFFLRRAYRGSIRGHVVDPSGSVMAGAKVTAKNNATGLTRETVTGSDGGYVLAELPAGRYVVMAQAPNLRPVAQNVIVNVGLDTTADFDLTQVERRQEQVTVTDETSAGREHARRAGRSCGPATGRRSCR